LAKSDIFITLLCVVSVSWRGCGETFLKHDKSALA